MLKEAVRNIDFGANRKHAFEQNKGSAPEDLANILKLKEADLIHISRPRGDNPKISVSWTGLRLGDGVSLDINSLIIAKASGRFMVQEGHSKITNILLNKGEIIKEVDQGEIIKPITPSQVIMEGIF